LRAFLGINKMKLNKIKLYKFRSLANGKDLNRIKDIIENGFYCSNFLDFNDMNESVFSINLENINITLDQKQEYKICSFSKEEALDKQLMWGHYANAGMGIAIEVVNDCENMKEVNYEDSYKGLNTIEEILTHKTKEWKYEHECRYISKDDVKLKTTIEKKTVERCGVKEKTVEKNVTKIKIEKITKIYFGTPYEELGNYGEIKKIHTKLRKYLYLKEELKSFCNKIKPKITCEDYYFNKPTKK
jgi:hypothetical protein